MPRPAGRLMLDDVTFQYTPEAAPTSPSSRATISRAGWATCLRIARCSQEISARTSPA
jgi:hypothetical protein